MFSGAAIRKFPETILFSAKGFLSVKLMSRIYIYIYMGSFPFEKGDCNSKVKANLLSLVGKASLFSLFMVA